MPKEQPVVWVVNNSGHNYAKAKRFGRLRFLTPNEVNPLAVDRVVQELSEVIGGVTHEDDYLLISGTPILNALALVLWLRRHGSCKVLQWNAKRERRDYEMSTVDEKHLSQLIDSAMIGV